MYSLFLKFKRCKTEELKWTNEFLLSENEWKNISCLPFYTTRNSYLQWFQYKLNNKILATNNYLKKLHIKKDDKCTFCKKLCETTTHLFWECYIVNDFWMEIMKLVKAKCHKDLYLNGKEAIFGILKFNKETKPINFLCILIRNFIFKMKVKGKTLNLQEFISYYQTHFIIQNHVAIKTNEIEEF